MIIKLYDNHNNPKVYEQIADLLERGGVVVYPTDTRYALGCSCLRERAVERICSLKGIDPSRHYLSLVCADMSLIGHYARVDDDTFKLIRRNTPGPFTFVLPPSRLLPRIFRGRHQVGVRIPDCGHARAICEALRAPLLSTSLPLADDDEPEYATDPGLIAERWEDQVDAVIDAGVGSLTLSTIVDCTDGSGEPIVTRQGAGVLDNE